MLGRVDELFKEKKEESMKLVWEISDLENQFEYLKRSTQEQAENSAIQGAAITWTQTHLKKLAADLFSFRNTSYDKNIKACAALMEKLEQGEHFLKF